MKVYPLYFFGDDITAFLEGRTKELAGIAEKVLKSIKTEEEKGLKLSITEGGKEGKSEATASCSCLKEKFSGTQ